MAKAVPEPINIQSAAELSALLSSSTIVVVDFWAAWCGPCKAIAPLFEQLAASLTIPNTFTFARVDVDELKDVAAAYRVTAMPTFKFFRNGAVIETVVGANIEKLTDVMKSLADEAKMRAGGKGEGSSNGNNSADGWLGAALPRGYHDVTAQVDLQGLDLLNSDAEFGNARGLFSSKAPLAAKEKDGAASSAKEQQSDYVVSDIDEQLMLYIPFQSTLKIHTLQFTSFGTDGSDDDDERPTRPRTIKVYANHPHILGFDEADGVKPAQTIELGQRDWDDKTATAKVELRFVRFQNVSSLCVFVVDVHGQSDKVRLDRVRIIGESKEKRAMGKLEKIGDDP